MELTPYFDNAIPVIPTDYEYHTKEHPFCWDKDCPCHTDKEAIAQVQRKYEQGLLTTEEVIRTIQGAMV